MLLSIFPSRKEPDIQRPRPAAFFSGLLLPTRTGMVGVIFSPVLSFTAPSGCCCWRFLVRASFSPLMLIDMLLEGAWQREVGASDAPAGVQIPNIAVDPCHVYIMGARGPGGMVHCLRPACLTTSIALDPWSSLLCCV